MVDLDGLQVSPHLLCGLVCESLGSRLFSRDSMCCSFLAALIIGLSFGWFLNPQENKLFKFPSAAHQSTNA
jgi:hypothetical protein